MVTLLVLLAFGGAFAAFAILGPAERGHACERSRVGDPRCEHCAVDDLGADVESRTPDPGRGAGMRGHGRRG